MAIVLAVSLPVSAQTISDLKLTINPSGHVPLAAQLTFSTDKPALATLHIDDGNKTVIVTPKDEYATEHDLMVLGLRPGRTNSLRVTVKDRAGSEATSDILEIETDPIPDDFPPFDLKISRSRKMEPGYTLVPLLRWAGAGPDEHFGRVVARDARA